MREVVLCECDLAALELGVQGQRGEPRLRWVSEGADRRTRVGQEKPGSLLVVCEHLGDSVGPAGKKAGRQPRLECLHRTA